MDISIIIVNWNTAELTLQCLDSIYRTECRSKFEIIVVDNGSTDNSINLISQKFPDVRIIANDRNLGFAKANNLGIAAGSGRYFLLLNSDTIVLTGSFDKLISVADAHPVIGVIGPKLLNMDGTLQRSWAGFPTFWSELIGINFRYRRSIPEFPFTFEVDWIMGACMLVRSETVRDVGLLDENFFMYSEETDWCYRIKKKGWDVWYLSAAEICHLGGGSANRASLTQLLLLYYGKIMFFRKHYGDFQATLLRYGLAVANALGLMRRVIFLLVSNNKIAQQRLVAQAKLIVYLLQNRYPEINTQRNN